LSGKFIAPLFCVEVTVAQTTGKIAGKIVDKATDEPLVAANMMLPDTSFGAAADLDGNFSIINIPPGIYNVQAKMLGYTSLKTENIQFSVN
jgi:type III secretion system FlhB-like substrate exporter